jgi:PAS domain S-box-containing protein
MSNNKKNNKEGPAGLDLEIMDQPGSNGLGTDDDLHKALKEASRYQRDTLALLDAARAVMAHERFAEAAREIFDHCRQVIGSPSGYVSLANEAGTANELVFLEAGGLTCTVDPDLPMPIRGLRALAYESGEVTYDNDFARSDLAKFLPLGHVVLENVLFAPLKTPDQQTVGLLGLANKPGGFTEYDACLAAGFAEIAAIALVSKRAAEALQENEEKYRSIFESAPIGIFKATPEGKFLEVNPALVAILGYDSVEDLIETVNKTRIAQHLFVDPEGWPQIMEESRGCGDWCVLEIPCRQRSGRIVAAKVKLREVRDREGVLSVEGFIAPTGTEGI